MGKGSLVESGGYPLDKHMSGWTMMDHNKEALNSIGLPREDKVDPEPILELHIEQGAILYQRGFHIGVVEGCRDCVVEY